MEKDKKLALVTRPYADSVKFEGELAQVGVDSFIEPFLEIQLYHNASKIIRPYLDSCQALVATSANAVRAIGYTKKTIITVGEKTAQAAKEIGFENVYTSKGDVENLERYVENNFSAANGGLLYVSGDIIANDFSPEGFKINRVVVYNSIPIKKISSKCEKYFKEKQFDFIFFFSRRTAQVFVEHASAFDLNNIKCFCLSEKIKDVISDLDFKDVVVSENFDLNSISKLVKE